MPIDLDEQGNPMKPFIIVQAGSALQMEQLVIDFMKQGYEHFGELSFSDGVFTQAMRTGKKRTSM